MAAMGTRRAESVYAAQLRPPDRGRWSQGQRLSDEFSECCALEDPGGEMKEPPFHVISAVII